MFPKIEFLDVPLTHKKNILPVLIVGTGPAGLMVASVLSKSGHPVIVCEKKTSPAKKFLIAGASGLNVSFDAAAEHFHEFYSGPSERLQKIFHAFSPTDWIGFIENLGIKTFRGTSGRVFIEGLKTAPLLKAWLKMLKARGVIFRYRHECVGFDSVNFEIKKKSSELQIAFSNGTVEKAAAVCFSLGGGSYVPEEKPLRWPEFFTRKGILFREFTASNSGFQVAWPDTLLKEVEGQPLKNVVLITARGQKKGDLVITRYGLEGTPVYHVGIAGDATLDLKPDLDEDRIRQKLFAVRENLSPLRRAKKTLNLSDAALALVFHVAPRSALQSIESFTQLIKNFPLTLSDKRPLDEAISSAGGLSWDELDENLMLKKFPRVFAAGEMLDWDAPTGGFLIQACASQGFLAGQGMLQFLSTP